MLPNHKETYYDIEVSEYKLKIRAWKTKDEKAYLIKKQATDLDDTELFNILIKPCIQDADKYNFTENEKIYIMIKIREISLGSDISINYNCSSCNKYNEAELNLSETVKFKKSSYSDIKIDDYVFKIARNNSAKAEERLKDCTDPIERDYINLILSIYEFTYKGEVYDAFTFDELYEYINERDTKLFDELIEQFFNMQDSISTDYEVKCLFCEEVNKGSLSSIPNFLWD